MKKINIIILLIITVIVSVSCSNNEKTVVYQEYVTGVDIIYAKESVTKYFIGAGFDDIESMEYVPYTEDNIVYKNELSVSNNIPENVIVIEVNMVNSPQNVQMVTVVRNNKLSGPNKWEVVNVSQGAKKDEKMSK